MLDTPDHVVGVERDRAEIPGCAGGAGRGSGDRSRRSVRGQPSERACLAGPLPGRGAAGPAGSQPPGASHPWQIPAELEAAVCELRRAHRKWGPKRLVFEMGRRGLGTVTRSTVYRVLVRNQLIEPRSRRRRRQDYVRWERPVPMQLWQLDVTASAFLADGTEVKIVTGLDDHSRYCVIARAVMRATARPVCRAFVEAMTRLRGARGSAHRQRHRVHRPVHQAAPGRGAVRADLPGERHHRAADQAPVADDHGQDRAAAPVPAGRAAGRAWPVRLAGGAAGRAGCLAGGVQHRPAAPVAGHGLPGLPVRSRGIAAAAAGAAPAGHGQRAAG